LVTRHWKAATLLASSAALIAGTARAQPDRPRFVILLDNSTSMTENLSSPVVQTHGDGSQAHPGCDLDGKSTSGWAYDDSKLFLAKAAVVDTISAFGAAEFALATYSRTLLGQPCTADAQCSAVLAGAVCVDLPGDSDSQRYCARRGEDSYRECASGESCTRCANPADSNDLVFEGGPFDCTLTKCSFANGCIGGQVIVGFPTAGSANLTEIYRWIDGLEDLPSFSASSNREVRASTMTPIGSALDSLRAWLADASRIDVGLGAGLLSADPAARDPRLACRSYSIILITDGEDTCSPSANDPVTAAATAFRLGINVYVVGFGVGNRASLNSIAMAGSGDTRSAYFASNRSQLIASLGDILMSSMSAPRCNCDATCDDEAAAFPLKGQPCIVGVGRCKRQGLYTCNGTADGVMCAKAAICGAAPLLAGEPAPEQCGTLPGCEAPTAADCADENCDGLIDEGLVCSCASKPEICNGADDDCNGVVDDIVAAPCGLDLGACRPGVLACAPDAAGGQTTICQGPVGPSPEVCDGLDNDCNGLVDDLVRSCYPEGAAGCTFDAASAAWACVGACQTGRQACAAGAWQPCVAAVTPAAEIACDELDNNCDGVVDENNPAPVTGCYPAGMAGCEVATGVCVGRCALGHPACAANRMGLFCAGAKTPVSELCNGEDDDCDGSTDEDFPTLGLPCNQQSCQGAGQLVCNAKGTDVECTVSAAGPSPEACDGRDNDCDGQIDEAPGPGEAAMPGVGVPCGSEVGECRPGVSACTAGKIVCSAVGPAPEACDGLDNDCNGSVDDGVVPPGAECNPAGLGPSQPLLGECRPGSFTCRGAEGWRCQGGVGPAPEVCDGKDNDCDGVLDNDARCAPGYVCIEGECVQTCHEVGENPRSCPADRHCANGVCLVKACARTPCPAGHICQADGTCVDPCSLVTCPAGASCVNGVCVDCYTQGCPAGRRCIGRQCVVDPCESMTCGADQLCRAGICAPSCAGVVCEAAQVCTQGACVPSPCPNPCPADYFCDPATALCRPTLCAAVPCLAGQVCVSSTGRCVNDPCELVRCGAGALCVVKADGTADCALPEISGVPQVAKTSGGGCSCRVGRQGQGAPAGLVLVLGLLWVARRRARL